MADSKSPTEQATDAGKKILKKTLKKSFGFIIKIIISITLPLILLVSSLYVIFNAATADGDFEEWVGNDETVTYE